MIIILNNKSNLGKEEFLEYQEELSKITTNQKIVLCPTYLNINLFQLNNMSLGAQNVSSTDKGAYTGEVCAKHLKDSGVAYCIVGHSERRERQNESNEEIHEKIKRLLEVGIKPVLCVGETKEEREQGLVEKVLLEKTLTAITELSGTEKDEMIIAYEPIWSIGTGIIPTIEEIEDAFRIIKKVLPNNTIIYGGSANDENVDFLKQSSMIEGFLVGGLSLKPQELQSFLTKLESK